MKDKDEKQFLSKKESSVKEKSDIVDEESNDNVFSDKKYCRKEFYDDPEDYNLVQKHMADIFNFVNQNLTCPKNLRNSEIEAINKSNEQNMSLENGEIKKKSSFKINEEQKDKKLFELLNKLYLCNQNIKFKRSLNKSFENDVNTKIKSMEKSTYDKIIFDYNTGSVIKNFYGNPINAMLFARFDDKKPIKETLNHEKWIKNNMRKLKTILGSKNSLTRCYLTYILEFTHLLIKSGNAYLDNTAFEEIKRQIDCGERSKNRDLSIDENLSIFDLFVGGNNPSYCVRAKINYLHSNKEMRDPIIYVSVGPEYLYVKAEPITLYKGDNFYKKIFVNDNWQYDFNTYFWQYPIYDFAYPIIDCLMGVTHLLRSKKYKDKNKFYLWVIKNTWNNLEMRKEVFNKYKKKIYIKEKNKNELIFDEKRYYEDNKIIIDPEFKGTKRIYMRNAWFKNVLAMKDKIVETLRQYYILADKKHLPRRYEIERRKKGLNSLVNYIITQGIIQAKFFLESDKSKEKNWKKKIKIYSNIYGVNLNNFADAEISNWSEVISYHRKPNSEFTLNSKEKLDDLDLKDDFIIELDDNEKSKFKVTRDLIIQNQEFTKDKKFTLLNLGIFTVEEYKEAQKNCLKSSGGNENAHSHIIIRFDENQTKRKDLSSLKWSSKKYGKRYVLTTYKSSFNIDFDFSKINALTDDILKKLISEALPIKYRKGITVNTIENN